MLGYHVSITTSSLFTIGFPLVDSHGRFRHAFKDIIVEVHNKYNTLNTKDKSHNLNSLRRLKSQEIIYGCITDRFPKDTFTNGNVGRITGDLFLHFMLGDEAVSVQDRLKYFIYRFNCNELTSWIRHLN